jgi:hypothetical protein
MAFEHAWSICTPNLRDLILRRALSFAFDRDFEIMGKSSKDKRDVFYRLAKVRLPRVICP